MITIIIIDEAIAIKKNDMYILDKTNPNSYLSKLIVFHIGLCVLISMITR